MESVPRKNPTRKRLTQSQKDAIRAAKGLQADIAIRFGVTQACVSLLKSEKRGGSRK